MIRFLLIENYVLFSDFQYCFRSPYLSVDLVTDAGDTNAGAEKESGLFAKSGSVGYSQM